MKKIALVLLLTTAGCAGQKVATSRAPQGDFLDKCKDVIKSVLSPQSKKQISLEQRENFAKILESWDRPEYGRLLNSSPEHFAVLVMESPALIRELLRNIPKDKKLRILYFHELRDLTLGLEDRHLMQSFTDYMHRKLNDFGKERFDNANEIIDDAAFIYRNLSSKKLSSIKKSIDDYWERHLAIKYYEKNFYVNLEIVTEGKKKLIKVKNELYPYKLKNGDYLLKVPRDHVRIRGDNPLDTKKLMSMASSVSLPAPRVYKGHIGLNGHFYLDDGNHRFTARESRKAIWINIGEELRTLGVMHHLIYMGGTSPSDKALIDLYHQKISIYDTLSEGTRRKMLWDESELFVRQK